MKKFFFYLISFYFMINLNLYAEDDVTKGMIKPRTEREPINIFEDGGQAPKTKNGMIKPRAGRQSINIFTTNNASIGKTLASTGKSLASDAIKLGSNFLHGLAPYLPLQAREKGVNWAIDKTSREYGLKRVEARQVLTDAISKEASKLEKELGWDRSVAQNVLEWTFAIKRSDAAIEHMFREQGISRELARKALMVGIADKIDNIAEEANNIENIAKRIGLDQEKIGLKHEELKSLEHLILLQAMGFIFDVNADELGDISDMSKDERLKIIEDINLKAKQNTQSIHDRLHGVSSNKHGVSENAHGIGNSCGGGGKAGWSGGYNEKKQKHGVWTWTSGNGGYAKNTYVNGILNGSHGTWAADCSPIEWHGNYVSGKKDGAWKWIASNGGFSENTYVNGVLNGPHGKWTAEGKPIEWHGNYVNGKKDGVWKWIASNGGFSKNTYVNGVLDGLHGKWTAEGKPIEWHGSYSAGRKEGGWTFYCSNGNTTQNTYSGGVAQGQSGSCSRKN